MLFIDHLNLHHNRKQWIEPHKFIPERFDPKSKYYLTPSGDKRLPYSFAPFLGGNRICVGKTFAETIAKYTGPSILGSFNFSFVDQEKYCDFKPMNNLISPVTPEIMVNVKNDLIN